MRGLAFLNGLLLVVNVALLGCCHDGRVYNLSAHSKIAVPGKMFVEPGKQIIHCARLCYMLAKQPDCLYIRHLVAQFKANEAHEGEPVIDNKLGLII